MTAEGSVGVFDSGLGGLTVLKEIVRVLPREDTIYLGDTARVPYGIRSPETVLLYSVENTNFLVSKHVKILVIACNTASAVSVEQLRRNFALPVVEVITPGAKKAAQVSRTGRIGVIGTETTIRSQAYQRAIRDLNPQAAVFAHPCPLFVPLAEEGWTGKDDTICIQVVERYLRELKDKRVDTLILGCTHYPLLKEVIGEVMGASVVLVDSACETAREVARTLRQEGLVCEDERVGGRQFFVTDFPNRFLEIGTRFFGQELTGAAKIDLP
jgi:glutamate racemase